MNKVLLVGRLTRDPEIRTLTSGSAVANFSIAVNRNFRNREGNVEADFINIVVYGRQVENIQKYVFKGNMVGIEGRMQTRSYDAQDGSKRYVTEVIADNVEFLSSKNSNSSEPVNAYVDTTSSVYMDAPSSENGIDVSTEDPFKDFGSEVALSDDDLPF